ncbi:MAG: 50S ribosomal protein L38e [Nitrososphaerota archaeon]
MPRQVFDAKLFKRLIEKADEIRVVRLKDAVKVKARTKKSLYTYVAEPSEADRLLRNLSKPVVEIGAKKEDKKSKKEASSEKKKEEDKGNK